jgi:hypothetical protein
VDGSRFDYDATGYKFDVEKAFIAHFVSFNINDGKKYINVDNIVSITDTVIDDGKA